MHLTLVISAQTGSVGTLRKGRENCSVVNKWPEAEFGQVGERGTFLSLCHSLSAEHTNSLTRSFDIRFVVLDSLHR